MFADRLGLTGTGGGGTGDSRERISRWRAFRVASSSFRAREEDEEDMALDLGSRLRGRRVKVSVSSILNRGRNCDFVRVF